MIKEYLKKLSNYLKELEEIIMMILDMIKDSKHVIMVIALLVSFVINILSMEQLQTTINNISTSMNSSFESGIHWIKSLSSDYSGVLGFLGSFLGGCMAIFVYKLQVKNQKKQDIKRLMFLTLDTYKSMKILDLNGNLNLLRGMKDADRLAKFKERHNGLVYDKEWSKLICNLSNFEDARNLGKWFYSIEQMVIISEDQLHERYEFIADLLCRYGYSKELEFINKEFEQDQKTVGA